MGYVGPLGKNLNFLSPLGSLNFFDFLSFLFILKLPFSKPFHNTLNYASTANIEEVMKFYNLAHKTFETDFSFFERYLDKDEIYTGSNTTDFSRERSCRHVSCERETSTPFSCLLRTQ